MGRGSDNRKEWQQKNKEDKAAAEAEAAAAEAEEDEDELLLQDEERPSLLTRSHRLLQRLLLSTGWELFMCSSLSLPTHTNRATVEPCWGSRTSRGVDCARSNASFTPPGLPLLS